MSERILIVEDDPGLARLMHKRLEREDSFSCQSVHSIAAAAEVLNSQECNLILMDYDLPDGNGLEFFERLRASGSEIPVVMITANGNEKLAVAALKEGFADYVVKDATRHFFDLITVVAVQVIQRAKNDRQLKFQREQAEQLYHSLVVSNERLRQLNEEKNFVLGMVGHDLRNPLANIEALVDLLSENPDAEELRVFIREILQQTEQARDLLENLLQTVELDRVDFKLSRDRIHLSDLLRSLIPSFQRRAAEKEIEIEEAIQPGICVYGDGGRLVEVFQNLIGNAVKYTYPNTTVKVGLEQDSRSIRATVQDEGPGFSERDRSKLFGRFQRLSARPTGGESSSGLGLFIVKTLVDAHGATIRLASDPGHGAKFEVEFPLEGKAFQASPSRGEDGEAAS